MIGQIAFLLISGIVFYIAFGRYRRIYRNIQLGKKTELTGTASERWKNVLLIAFGQKKMFKRPIPALLHFFIYAAFLLTQIELIEIIIDGISGSHRIFSQSLGGFYTMMINFVEILSLLALVATFIFLWRRNMLKLPRFHSKEMEGWPFRDANLILFGELILVLAIFTMNGSDYALQKLDPTHYPSTGPLLISGLFSPIFEGFSQSVLVVLERIGWWMHYLVVLAFILYLPFSKHLHIFLAFFNVYYAPTKPRGEMNNMPDIQKEVGTMLGLIEETEPMDPNAELPEFGAKDVFDLPRHTILAAYSCTECGRCTSACPANQTGKKLSPRKIMMAIRDRTEEVGQTIGDQEQFDDGKSLFDYIEREELHACTTCNACVEECPILINPLEPILELRRYEILTESAGPADWLPMFTSLENTNSPWQLPDSRDNWAIQARENND